LKMMNARIFLSLLFLACVCLNGEAISSAPKSSFLQKLLRAEGLENLKNDLKRVDKFVQKSNRLFKTQKVQDITVECGLCGIVMNEIEGLLSENLTQEEIQQAMIDDFCSAFSGSIQQACISLANQIPEIIARLENAQSVGVICVELKYCVKPFAPHPDLQPIPQYVINLDLPPQERWKEICSNPQFQNVSAFLINFVDSMLPGNGKILEDIGMSLNQFYFPTEYAQEIQGCAEYLGMPYGWLTLFNLGYEVSDACTSIVAQTTEGKIYHARNLDFWDGMGFTDSLKDMAVQLDYQKGGKTVFVGTGFAGFAGVLSGMKPNGFSVTIDTRFYPEGLWELLYEVVAAITENNASLVTFLSRTVLTNENDFAAAIDNLSNDALIADVYYIVAGVNPGEGAVISRNRLNATDVWRLDSPSRWFEVETNYDHWKQPPWFDDRIDPADKAMNAMGQPNLTLEGMLQVLSTKPVMNLQTTYSILACPGDGTYKSWLRYCEYPCVE